MSNCKDREDIASIVFTDDLDITYLHEPCISLVEFIIVDMISIGIRNNRCLSGNCFDILLYLTSDDSISGALKDRELRIAVILEALMISEMIRIDIPEDRDVASRSTVFEHIARELIDDIFWWMIEIDTVEYGFPDISDEFDRYSCSSDHFCDEGTRC